jgi:hypothetical protein
MGSQGELYGTAGSGGSTGWGTVFRLQPPSGAGTAWNLTTLYTFSVGYDGVAPSSIVMGKGVLYGTTRGGSLNPVCGPFGCGTVYSLGPNPGGSAWKHTVLHRFSGQDGDGPNPFGGLVYTPAGVLYGSTAEGGTGNCAYMSSPGCGTVYQLTPPATTGGAWTHSVLYSFAGPAQGDGQDPNPLALGANGALYGTTNFGGNITTCGEYCGTVFELTPPAAPGGAWTETLLYSFLGTTDGGWPQSAVILSHDGAILGTTGLYYHGNIFEIDPPSAPGNPWTFVSLGNFEPRQQGGAMPTGPLAIDQNGVLYGTTSELNSYGGFGTVFQLVR